MFENYPNGFSGVGWSIWIIKFNFFLDFALLSSNFQVNFLLKTFQFFNLTLISLPRALFSFSNCDIWVNWDNAHALIIVLIMNFGSTHKTLKSTNCLFADSWFFFLCRGKLEHSWLKWLTIIKITNENWSFSSRSTRVNGWIESNLSFNVYTKIT